MCPMRFRNSMAGTTEVGRGLTTRLLGVVRRRRVPSSPSTAWPVVLHGVTPTGVAIELRPLRHTDEGTFAAVRRLNYEWLNPWDATAPISSEAAPTFAAMVDRYTAQARLGQALPFAITVGGRLVGQLMVATITYGSFRSGAVGYWVAQELAGRGVVPTALALAGDHAMSALGLHRLEVNIRPENAASLAVVRKLGFREEGYRRHFLHIDGEWRDHRSFALTVEDLAGETWMERLARLTANPDKPSVT